MKIGILRIQLAKILTEITGNDYLPEGIRQTNVTLSGKCWSDPYYFIARPPKHGMYLASSYTMREIIDAYNKGDKIAISNYDEITIIKGKG